MGKLKGIVIILLVVAGGSAGAIIGLNRLVETELAEELQKLTDAVPAVKQLVRSLAFEDIRRLAERARAQQLLALVGTAPQLAADMVPDQAAAALADFSTRVLPELEKQSQQLPQRQLALVTGDGFVAAATADTIKRGSNWKGLPVIEHCLGGFAGDGWYRLNDAAVLLATAPVLDAGGKVVGCLVTARPLSAAQLGRWSKPLGLDAVLLVDGKVLGTTLENGELSKSLAAQQAAGDKPVLVGTAGKQPLLLRPQAALAMVGVKLPSGGTPLTLALIRDLRPLLVRAADWQKQLFFGAGALLVVGVLLVLVLAGNKLNRQLTQLTDAVKLIAEGGSSTLDFDSFSEPLSDLAQAIKSISERSGKPQPYNGAEALAAAEAEFSPAPRKATAPTPSPPAAPVAEAKPATALDFESLLEQAEQPETAPSPTAEPEPAPVQEPAPVEDVAPTTQQPVPQAPAAAAAGPGPRVELPGDLANIFGESEETREVDTTSQQQALREYAAPDLPPPPAGAMAASTPELDGDDDSEAGEYRSDATVIAEVPSELISLTQKTSGESSEEVPTPAIPPPPAPIPAPPRIATPAVPPPPVAPLPAKPALAASGDEQHFRQVFEQFLETKKQCGEAVGNLSFEKFAQKLRKNSEDLKARYGCRTVKFQVYVKNGKAALKATPVK